MELATMTGNGQADGAMRHAVPADGLGEESPRARGNALASEISGRTISIEHRASSIEHRASSIEHRSHDSVLRAPDGRFRTLHKA